jgi:hypothetical protein
VVSAVVTGVQLLVGAGDAVRESAALAAAALLVKAAAVSTIAGDANGDGGGDGVGEEFIFFNICFYELQKHAELDLMMHVMI